MVDFVGMRSGFSGSIPFSDGSFFDDDAGFENQPMVTIVQDAPAGSTEIVVDMTSAGGTIVPGQILSHNDFPFGVISMEGPEEETVIRIEMPLRKPIASGELINLYGTGIFEMVDPRTGNPIYDVTLISRVGFELREWLR